MAVIKVDIEKPYDEFDIGGKVYNVYFDDESLRKYEKTLKEFRKETQTDKDPLKMSEKQRSETEKKHRKAIKKAIDCFFGEGSYEEIYALTGKSMIMLARVVEALFNWLDGKLNHVKKKQLEYYTK